MQAQLFALLMTLIGAAATTTGGLIAVLLKPSKSLLGHMLSFASGVMLIISFTDMYVESVEKIGGTCSSIAVLMISILLLTFVFITFHNLFFF